jgi:hypothetical protein
MTDILNRCSGQIKMRLHTIRKNLLKDLEDISPDVQLIFITSVRFLDVTFILEDEVATRNRSRYSVIQL